MWLTSPGVIIHLVIAISDTGKVRVSGGMGGTEPTSSTNRALMHPFFSSPLTGHWKNVPRTESESMPGIKNVTSFCMDGRVRTDKRQSRCTSISTQLGGGASKTRSRTSRACVGGVNLEDAWLNRSRGVVVWGESW